MTNIARYLTHIPFFMLCTFVAGCSQDDVDVDIASGKDIRFDNTTLLVTRSGTSTRAINPYDPINGGYAGLEASDSTIYITVEKPWGDICLNMKVDGEDKGGIVKYKPESGMTGQLISCETGQSLKWENSTSEHLFHAWTIPENSTNTIVMAPDGKTGMVNFGPFYDESKVPLEYFIGTMIGPLTYKGNGLSVSMEFRHLVSKIYIRNITRIRSDGSRQIISSGSNPGILCITFPDMPQQGLFNAGLDKNEFPSVVADVSSDKGVVAMYSPFHFPPFNFDEYGRFEVTLDEKDEEGILHYMYTYYGHLKDITTLKELKAGEAMALDLILADGKVTGMSVWIVNWYDEPAQTISIPAKKGIYSYGDLWAAYNNGKGWNWDDYAVEKVIRLYNNLDLTSEEVVYIPIPDGYVFDGMGHNIKGNVTFGGEGTVHNLYINGKSV